MKMKFHTFAALTVLASIPVLGNAAQLTVTGSGSTRQEAEEAAKENAAAAASNSKVERISVDQCFPNPTGGGQWVCRATVFYH